MHLFNLEQLQMWELKHWLIEAINNTHGYGLYKVNLFRLVRRTGFMISTTLISMLLPFFNDVVGILGVVGFWPLTVYFPVKMYIV